jgi:S-formylglutathione hydrolase FrmB
MRFRYLVLAVVVVVFILVELPLARAAVPTSPSCAPVPSAAAPLHLTVGTVACQDITTEMLGPGIAAPFAYYIPPECDPARRVQCPVLYLLHGFGGSYTEMVGTPDHPSAWVASLTSQPPPGFESAPWEHADPHAWGAAPHLPLILVAPLGQTLPGGYGPGPGLDSYWIDWNPRYANGVRYAGPPPRFGSYLIDELVPFVAANFPTGADRGWRAIGGVSLGGYGSYVNGLRHPDEWTSMLSVSGAMNFLFAPGIDPSVGIGGLAPPVQLPAVALPALTGVVPRSALPSAAGTFLTALDALGDPVADQAYFRGNTPRDLAMNGHNLGIDGFVNDTIPRQTSDLTDVTALAFEDIVFPMNIDMQLAFAGEHVTNTFAIHQGIHSDTYRNAWLRGLEEYAYARLDHPDGSGHPPAAPASFEYRTVDPDFAIWGWHVQVKRPVEEFLEMRSVSCHSVSLQGTGLVTITVPPACHTGVGGHTTFQVDLGPSFPFDEPLGVGALPVYGRTATIALTAA